MIPSEIIATEWTFIHLNAEETGAHRLLSGIVRALTIDPQLRDDLMQEALRDFHLNRGKFPEATISWHLQRCRMQLLDYLGQGRSVDSLKRRHLGCPVPDQSEDETPMPQPLVMPESVREVVSVRDAAEELGKRLSPTGRRVLKHLWQGHTLREIGDLIGISASRVWEHRKEIGAVAMALGLCAD